MIRHSNPPQPDAEKGKAPPRKSGDPPRERKAQPRRDPTARQPEGQKREH